MDPNTYLLIVGGVTVAAGSLAFTRAIWKKLVDEAKPEERQKVLGNPPQPKWYHDAKGKDR